MTRRNKITHFERVRNILAKQMEFELYEKIKELNTEKLGTKQHITSLLERILPKRYTQHMKEHNPLIWEFICSHMTYTFPFYMNNQKVFEFDEGITQLFLRTHLEEIDESQIQFPFDAFYIKVPSKLFPFGETKDGTPCYVEGVYVSQARIPQSKIPHERAMCVAAVLHPFDQEITPETNLNDYEYFGFPIYREGDIYSMLEDFVNQEGFRFNDELRSLFSFIFNAILYINSDKAVIENIKTEHIDVSRMKSTKKRTKAERNNRKYSNLEHFYVGNILIDHRLKKEIEQEQQQRKKTKGSYQSQWIVRGHWRKQSYGENYSKRKLIWVKPYIKGCISEPLVNKKYKVR